jgi:hypothetical protein
VPEATPWRRCSACKKPIALGAVYWSCNVSTCNQKRTALCFCSVSCWEVHLPGANHREAWAVEKRAPKTPEVGVESAVAGGGGGRRLVRGAAPPPPPPASDEVLIVASRLATTCGARSGYNTRTACSSRSPRSCAGSPTRRSRTRAATGA